MKVTKATIALVGPGRAGRAFARSWTAAGGSIVLVARRPRLLRPFAREIGAAVRSLADRAPIDADVLVIAVPDDSISSVAERLARRSTCRVALHFSGALSSAELSPFSAAGARVASMHPLRAFPGSREDAWTGAYVAVEGDAEAVRIASAICRRAGGRPHRIEAAMKPLYHAAATLAAGGTGSLLSVAVRLWCVAGLAEEEGRRALADLAATAVDAVRRLPFDRALTGPVARRDLATVDLHARSLAGRPAVRIAAELYALLAAETLRRTPRKGAAGARRSKADREMARLLSLLSSKKTRIR